MPREVQPLVVNADAVTTLNLRIFSGIAELSPLPQTMS